jgi:hypothetical protein
LIPCDFAWGEAACGLLFFTGLQKFGGKGKERRQTYSMSNRHKGIPHRVRESLILFRIPSGIFCKMMFGAHILIITPYKKFDKPYKLWYKFSRGKVLKVRNVLVWGYKGLDRNVLVGESFGGS